jgi:hypothetical protein
MKDENVVYIVPKAPPEFKKLADIYFKEMRKLSEGAKNGQKQQ